LSGQPKFCNSCGSPLKQGAGFCGTCGQPVNPVAGPGAGGRHNDSAPEAATSDRAGNAPASENNGRGNVLEVWRRVLLAVFLCAAVWLAFYAPLTPLFTVSPVDFTAEQKKTAKGYMAIVTEEKKRLAGLPLNSYIEEITKDKVVPVEGQQWDNFYESIFATLQGLPPDRELAGRVGQYRDKIYFRAGEAPVSWVSRSLNAGEEIYLKLTAGSERYIRLRRESLGNDDFRPGSGISGPPARVLYPYRRYSPMIAVAGLALYILLPRPKWKENIISYPRWRIAAGDFASLLLLVVFFSLPVLIVGGSAQAATTYFPLALVFWAFAAMGGWILKMMAWQAGLQLEILPGGLRRITNWGREDYFFKGIEYIQPIIQAPPRWLVWLSWLGAFAGRSVSSAGAALILAGTEYGGIRMVCRDGRVMNIWFTDQLGSIALPGYDRILEALRDAGVPVKKDVMRVEAIATQ